MGGGGGGSPAAAPMVPSRSDADLEADAAKQRDRFYGSQGGRAATMLTGGNGVTSGSQSAVVKLLGQVGR